MSRYKRICDVCKRSESLAWQRTLCASCFAVPIRSKGTRYCLHCKRRLTRQEAQREWTRQNAKRIRYVKKPKIHYACEECGIDFQSSYEGRRFCSEECRRVNRSFNGAQCQCKGCNADFSPRVGHQIYCSRGCASRASALRRYDRKRTELMQTQWEEISILELAIRDEWICHFCGEIVTKKNWSRDHIIPLSTGGSSTWDNLKLAHRSCNAKAKNKGFVILPIPPRTYREIICLRCGEVYSKTYGRQVVCLECREPWKRERRQARQQTYYKQKRTAKGAQPIFYPTSIL
jgi:hypothetical protein